MILFKNLLLIFVLSLVLFCASAVQAQDKMAITITPPIIKNNVKPGQIWKSYIKVVNNNAEDIDVYIELINFKAGNEAGTVKLAPLSSEEIKGNKYLINNWVHIEPGPITVPAYKGKNIPFIVDVPDGADPGDHHLAILVGTEPGQDNSRGSSIKISSKIGSLLLLNVGGEVNESGIIREFSTDKGSYSEGNVNFNVRFQNTGNTILQPRGEIRVYNWQEKDQGAIMINHQTNTGNVFPQDIRAWKYDWKVPTSILQMGRYRADMILSYGKQNAETVERTVYFWVVQWKPILISLAILIFIILLVILLIRRSIKKAVIRTQEQLKTMNPQPKVKPVVKAKPKTKKNIKRASSPRKVIDLKASIKKDDS